MLSLDHVTLRTRYLAASRDFFIDLFDLVEKERPRAIQPIPGHWLYADDEPIVHLIGAGPRGAPLPSDPRSAENWDHVGFRLKGYDAFKAKLEARQIPYSPMELPELGERRLFFHAPGGQLIEAVFREAENA